jgi:small subunit ribosomal protein S13
MILLGKHCPDEKGLCFTLQSIFGVNACTALKVCAMLGVHRNVALRTLLKTGRVDKLSRLCRDHISTSTERQVKQNIKHYLHIKHYKGVRHMFALPCRGQRTRTNASTSRRLAIVKHLDPKRTKKSGRSLHHRTKKSK